MQNSFLFISSYGAQQLAAPQLLRTWGCYTWEGDLAAPLAVPGGQAWTAAQHAAGPGPPPGTEVTLKVRARPPSLTTWPPAAPICTPNGTRPESTWVLPPCLCCVSRHYQPPYRLWNTVPVLPEQSDEALAGVVLCWRSRGSHEDVWRSLGPPPGSVTFLLCKL